jgi:hypothetical protein
MMAVSYHHDPGAGYLEVVLSGKLDDNDYKLFGPEVEQLMREYGRLRMLVVLREFHGWTPSGFWEDIKFDIKHFDDVDRLAVVGERRWQSLMTEFCRLFTTAEVKYFQAHDEDRARAWITEGQPAATGT